MKLPVLIVAGLLLVSLTGYGQTIMTIAGSGSSSFSGDDGAATNAGMQPMGLTMDNSGNIYITDRSSFTVRKIDHSGTITLFAGGGTNSLTNGVAATSVVLQNPSGLVSDATGNIYVCDENSCRVIKINTGGIVSIVAGSGGFGYSGDGGPATNANLLFPHGLAMDASGNLLIADMYNNVIRKVNASGIITTIAGNYAAGSGYGGDGGAATNAQLSTPTGVAVDATGNIYITDNQNSVIRKVDGGGLMTTIAGIAGSPGFNGDFMAATNSKLNTPESVTIDQFGNMYIADLNNNRIRLLSATGKLVTVAGNGTAGFSGDGGPATMAELNYPFSLVVDTNDDILFTDNGNFRVRQFTSAGLLGPDAVCAGNSDTIISLAPPGGSWGVTNSVVGNINATGVFNAVHPGVDTITYSLGAHTLKKAIRVDSASAGSVSGHINFCVGSNDTLTTTDPGGTWSSYFGYVSFPENNVIRGITAGVDIITYNVANACGRFSTEFYVNVMTAPDADTIRGEQFLCVGQSTTLTDLVIGGIWSASMPDTSVTIDATGVIHGLAPGTGIIEYTVSNQCGTASSLPYPVMVYPSGDCPVKTEVNSERVAKAVFAIYPNPANGLINVLVKDASALDASVTLRNVEGQIVFEKNGIDEHREEFEVRLKPGFYMASLKTLQEVKTTAIVVY